MAIDFNLTPLEWCPQTRRRIAAMPEDVRGEFGHALFLVPAGDLPHGAKPWKGEGPGVYELRADHDRDTFRAVYTVRFARAVYVLHCFQKKSKSGIKTPREDIATIHARLKWAEQDYERKYPDKEAP